MKNKNNNQNWIETLRYLYFGLYVIILAGFIYAARWAVHIKLQTGEGISQAENLSLEELVPTAEEQAVQEALKSELADSGSISEFSDNQNENETLA